MASTTLCAQTLVPPIVTECYRSMLGYPATAAVQYQLLKHLETVEASMICAILEYTAAEATRPTWAYANAIITRQTAMGSRTAEDFNRACAAFRQQKAQPAAYQPGYYRPAPKKVLAQQYNQRDYSGPEYANIDRMSPEDEALCATL